MHSIPCVFLAILLCISAGARAFAAASLTPLGINSVANGVNGDGSVVVGNSLGASGYEASRWTSAGGVVGLGIPSGGLSSYARGVNGDGSIVVGGSDYYVDDDNLGFRSFRWTAVSGTQDLGYLPGGGFNSVALGVSADGSVIVGSSDSASGYQAFRWTAEGGMQALGDLSAGWFNSEANGVSADGSVIVGTGTAASSSEAFRWTSAGGMVGLGILPGKIHSSAFGVNADGSVVVGNSGSGCDGGCAGEAFRWTSGEGTVGLGLLPGAINSFASGVSGDGSVVVGWSESNFHNSDRQAFRWTADGGIERLWDVLLAAGVDPAADGWSRLDFAKAISADGNTIVGDGIRNGHSEAFVAVIPANVPEPAGDFDHDGDVDGADFLVWQRGGSPNTNTGADLTLWRANFGAGSSSALRTVAPEPSSITLLALALLSPFRRRHRLGAPCASFVDRQSTRAPLSQSKVPDIPTPFHPS